jgi:hypothetical protein
VSSGDPAEQFRSRLSAVRDRLGTLATMPQPGGLTAPDQPSGEQWEWGQVWAHLAEFIPYWTGEMERVMSGSDATPVPFGRTKVDPGRVAAIERDRGRPVEDLWDRLRSQIAEFDQLLLTLPPGAWERRGGHPTLGVMDMPRIVNEFVVGHLEQHADQLDGLVAGGLP